MKAAVTILVIVMSLLLTTGISQSTLIEINDSRGHVIYDNVHNQYWIWELSAFSNQTYMQQLDTVLTRYVAPAYFGIPTWHLALMNEMSNLWSNDASGLMQFLPTRPPDGIPETIWQGRYEQWGWVSTTTKGHEAPLFCYDYVGPGFFKSELSDQVGPYYDDLASSDLGAWVTASSPVPEPATLLLLGVGIAGMAGIRVMKRLG